MFKTNEYYDGNVKSIAFGMTEGPATIGAMATGEYEFGTSSVEYMTITSGELLVMLPGETVWTSYKPFDTFVVDKGVKFKVKTACDTTYLCLYR
ncbi:MAG: pyrimidine/purine nucleoside phosphorylase [Bacteroidota bacterium]